MPVSNVLVLGSRVDDGSPDALLRSRLKRAVPVIMRMARESPQARVVVSGRGESAAMAEWLIEHGVPPQLIVEEPLATSTNENLENAHYLLPETEEWTVVTNDFHVPRTRMWAWHLGINIRVVPAVSPPEGRLRNRLYEVVKLPYSLTRVLWRRYRAR